MFNPSVLQTSCRANYVTTFLIKMRKLISRIQTTLNCDNSIFK